MNISSVCLLLLLSLLTPVHLVQALGGLSLAPTSFTSRSPRIIEGLRGGRSLDSSSEALPVWVNKHCEDEDGDSLTLFFHAGTSNLIEISHEYGDGGIRFSAGSSMVHSVADGQALKEEPSGFLAGFTEVDLLMKEGQPDELQQSLGDWTVEGTTGFILLRNKFYFSSLILTPRGDFFWISNSMSDYAIFVADGEIQEMSGREARSLMKERMEAIC